MIRFFTIFISLLLIMTNFAVASDIKLSLIGSGTRKVLILISIYDLHFYASNPDQFNKKRPLDSLDNQRAVQLQMHVLTATSASRLIGGLTSALEQNNVNIKKEGIQKLFDVLDVASKEGDIFVFTGYPSEDTLDVSVPGKDSVRITAPGIVQDVWSIWLGNTGHDGGLTSLKNSILK